MHQSTEIMTLESTMSGAIGTGEKQAEHPAKQQLKQQEFTGAAPSEDVAGCSAQEDTGEEPLKQPAGQQLKQHNLPDHTHHAATKVPLEKCSGEEQLEQPTEQQGKQQHANQDTHHTTPGTVATDVANLQRELRAAKEESTKILSSLRESEKRLEEERQKNTDLRSCFRKAALALMWETEVALTTAQYFAHNTTIGERWIR
jgi:hypothetical protein